MPLKSRGKGTILFIVLIGTFFSAGCGKIGDPVPPQLMKPQASMEQSGPGEGKAAAPKEDCENADYCGKKETDLFYKD